MNFKLLIDGDLQCKCCKLTKPISEFHKDSSSKRGFAYYCKSCANLRSRNWTMLHKDDPVYRKSKQDAHYKTTYGLTIGQRDSMYKFQNGECAICKTSLTLGINTHTDHCHTSNKIRGLLCGNCNRGLGSFKDNTGYLMEAIKYLQSHTDNGNQKEGRSL